MKYIITTLSYLLLYYLIDGNFIEMLDNNGWYEILHPDTEDNKGFAVRLILAACPILNALTLVFYIIMTMFTVTDVASFFGIDTEEYDEDETQDMFLELIDLIGDFIYQLVENIIDFIDDLLY